MPEPISSCFSDANANGCFQKLGVPQNGWFIVENPIKMDDLGVPLFLETPKCVQTIFFGVFEFSVQAREVSMLAEDNVQVNHLQEPTNV